MAQLIEWLPSKQKALGRKPQYCQKIPQNNNKTSFSSYKDSSPERRKLLGSKHSKGPDSLGSENGVNPTSALS
jgi:hypothetical protein